VYMYKRVGVIFNAYTLETFTRLHSHFGNRLLDFGFFNSNVTLRHLSLKGVHSALSVF